MKKSGGAIFLNVLGIFASVILSIIFVICAFALPVYYSVAGMLQPKTLTTVIQNIDYVEIIKQSPEVNKVIEDIGVDSTAANDIIKSKEVGKLLEDCTGKLTEILGDKAAKIEDLDASFLQGLVDEHIDDILNVVDEKTEIPISKEDIKTGINHGCVVIYILLQPQPKLRKTVKRLNQSFFADGFAKQKHFCFFIFINNLFSHAGFDKNTIPQKSLEEIGHFRNSFFFGGEKVCHLANIGRVLFQLE